MSAQPASRIAHAAFVRACRLDVSVRKPGNVSRASPGHGMQAQQFVDSAIVAAAELFVEGRGVGERIERAVTASFDAAGCNTNLGIVLLSAPLAAAAESPGALASEAALRRALRHVLDTLSIADARAAFRGIARANPGGLGRAEAQDVHDAPDMDLRQAMALAADRDSIARQYALGFADIFTLCAPLLASGLAAAASWVDDNADDPGPDTVRQVQRVYLNCLSAWPDSHIVRKWNMSTALQVSEQARAWLPHGEPDVDPAFAAWDDSMKLRGWNPGTSADMTVATMLTAGMLCVAASNP